MPYKHLRKNTSVLKLQTTKMSSPIIMIYGVSKTAILCYVDDRSLKTMCLNKIVDARKKKFDLL